MVVSASEIVATVRLRVELGERSHEVVLMYPYSMIEPIKEKLHAGSCASDVNQDLEWTNRFREKLTDCWVQLTAQFGTATVSVRDALNFSSGDVLILDQSPGHPVKCFVEGVPKFEGSAGLVKAAHAFRIGRILAES